jgi:hypothetical protein
MTIKTRDEFDTSQEYTNYLSQLQAEKNAQAEAEMLAREANQ